MHTIFCQYLKYDRNLIRTLYQSDIVTGSNPINIKGHSV